MQEAAVGVPLFRLQSISLSFQTNEGGEIIYMYMEEERGDETELQELEMTNKDH